MPPGLWPVYGRNSAVSDAFHHSSSSVYIFLFLRCFARIIVPSSPRMSPCMRVLLRRPILQQRANLPITECPALEIVDVVCQGGSCTTLPPMLCATVALYVSLGCTRSRAPQEPPGIAYSRGTILILSQAVIPLLSKLVARCPSPVVPKVGIPGGGGSAARFKRLDAEALIPALVVSCAPHCSIERPLGAWETADGFAWKEKGTLPLRRGVSWCAFYHAGPCRHP